MAGVKKVVCGVYGAGTVGGGVVILLRRMRERFLKRGLDISVKTVVCKDIEKPRDFELGTGVTKTSDLASVIKDEEIDVVVEVMGGASDARDVVMGAFRAGKHVVTANKALLAECLGEVTEELRSKPSLRFGYEAAVAGGIPVIRSLQQSFGGDSVKRVAGILNGTTNFMLTAMERDGVSYDAVLKQAQELGYAEADPTADVDGLDALAKLVILARLCFGVTVRPDEVPSEGIRRVTGEDFAYAALLESTIKLIGVAERVDDAVSIFLSPVLVSRGSTLGGVGGVDNIVMVGSDNLGEVAFRGPGAGRFATANSVVSDILAVCESREEERGETFAFPVAPSDEDLRVDFDTPARYYVRVVVRDTHGILRTVGALAERHELSLYSVLQTPIKTRERVAFVITTDATRRSQVQSFSKDIAGADWCLEDPFFMPFLDEAE